MKKLSLLLALFGLIGCTKETGKFYGSVPVGTKHPELVYIDSQVASGRNTSILTIDSTGGSTQEWRALAISDKVGMVVIKNECNSACLLYAVSVANKGIPVYVKNIQHLIWHGQIGANGTIIPQDQTKLDTVLWQIAGLPQWAADIENSLYGGRQREMTYEEFQMSGFKDYN
jgi:hypothetical protein